MQLKTGSAPRRLLRLPGNGFLKAVTLCAALLIGVAIAPAEASDRQKLGYSLAISNDSIGETRDRWQSSSVQFGSLWGPEWQGQAPPTVGTLLEFRFRTDLLTPEDLRFPAPTDRRHAGILAFGVHNHTQRGAVEFRLGADLVMTGPQTGLLKLQQELHEILGFPVPDLENFQIGNRITGALSAEIGRSFDLGNWRVRPFAEAEVGPEDLVRAGIDLTWGALGRDDLLLRANATGHRTPAIRGGQGEGWSFVLGADVAYVDDSIYLPASLGYVVTNPRTRLRAGVYHSAQRFDAFYGLTWLGREFEAQREGQFVGTLQVGLRF
jgi:Outer membrane protein LpxR